MRRALPACLTALGPHTTRGLASSEECSSWNYRQNTIAERPSWHQSEEAPTPTHPSPTSPNPPPTPAHAHPRTPYDESTQQWQFTVDCSSENTCSSEGPPPAPPAPPARPCTPLHAHRAAHAPTWMEAASGINSARCPCVVHWDARLTAADGAQPTRSHPRASTAELGPRACGSPRPRISHSPRQPLCGDDHLGKPCECHPHPSLLPSLTPAGVLVASPIDSLAAAVHAAATQGEHLTSYS